MREETGYLRRPDGTALAYRRVAGRGPTVVWMGGFRSDMAGTKAEVLADWALARGQAYVRFDYFGHGESEGDFAQGTISRWREDALAVPLYSVISRNDEQYVFVEEDGTARRRDVQLGIMEGWLVEVTDGLQRGDLVLIEGHRDVEEGQPIRVIHSFSDPLELSR